jgi:nucleoid-associated protein YgaU
VRHQIGRNCRCALKWDSVLIGIPPAMHTDRKIGFAMGILLIGIVAALFFRNEPLVDGSVPTVRRERELNQRLRERDVAVYLKDDAKDPSKTEAAKSDAETEPAWTLRDVLKNMDARNKSIPSPVVRSEKGLGKPRRKGESAGISGVGRRSDSTGPRGTAGPNSDCRSITDRGLRSRQRYSSNKTASAHARRGTDPGGEAQVTTAGTDRSGSATGNASCSGDAKPEFQPPAEFDEYVVKYGDTLSGIAQKMLGSQSRYQEIFEANRDRMASPDRLDVGKPIRIPRTTNKPL